MIEQRRYVVGFAIDTDLDKVVLIRKTHPPEQAGLLNGVGGRIELGESPVGAMIREFREETGLDIVKEDWLSFHYERQPEKDGKQTHLYFYVTKIDLVKVRPQSMTPEEICIIDVDHNTTQKVWPDDWKLMYNLTWLLPMARCYLEHPEHRYLEG